MLRYSFIVFIIVLFNACGGGGGSSGTTEQNPTSTSSISGTAIDGYISGATVCIDINNNSFCDTDEPSTTTNPDGTYSFSTSYIGTAPLLVIGGEDNATNKPFEGILKRKILITSNSSHPSKNITPLTTIAAEVNDSEIDILAQNLGLTKDDLEKDPMTDTKLFIKSQQIYQTTKDIAKLKKMDFKDIFTKVAQSIKENTNTNELNISLISSKLPTPLDDAHINHLEAQNNEINTTASNENNVSNLANLQKEQDDKNIAPFISGTPSTIAFLNINYSFTPTANDVDDDNLTFSISNKPSWATFNSSTGELSGVPSVEGNFSDINISVFDGINVSSLDIFSINARTNSLPTSSNTAFNINQNQILQQTINSFDTDGDTIQFIIYSYPKGTISLELNGTFIYTPSLNYIGTDSFRYQVKDSLGTNPTIYKCTITINEVITPPLNTKPVPIFTSFSTNEDTNYSGTLIATDVENDSLTYQITSNPSHGSITFDTNGSFTYSPSSNFNGSDSFIYKANDGNLDSDTQSVTITVSPINDKPVATFTHFTTDEDTTYNGILSGTDIENDSLSYFFVTNVSHGSLTVESNGSFSYTPTSNYSGSDSFTYKVYDGDKYSDVMSVDITVSPINDKPIPTFTSFNTLKNSTYNGTLTGNDVDNDTLTYHINSNSSHGTLSLNENGTFTYTPDVNYSGSDSFSYYVSDSSLNSEIQTVTITIDSINTKPVATSTHFDAIETASYPEDNILESILEATDNENDTLRYILVNAPTQGTISLETNGSFTYKNFQTLSGNKNDSFSYRVFDGNLYSDIQEVNITIIDKDIVAIVKLNGVQITAGNTYSFPENTNITFDGSDSYQYNYSIISWEWSDITSQKDLSSNSTFTESYSTYGTYQINMQITSTFIGFANSTSFNFDLNITTDTSLPPSNIPLSENGGLALPPQIPQ